MSQKRIAREILDVQKEALPQGELSLRLCTEASLSGVDQCSLQYLLALPVL